MFPWNYGFHWNAGTLIFMGAFYAVLSIVAATVAYAGWRTLQAMRARKVETIRWDSDFHDLPSGDRSCRHVFTGEFRRRECHNGFDCRTCPTHARLTAIHPPRPGQTEDDVLGMSFPLDRLYHRGHTWVRQEPDGTVTVGLDDLGQRLLGEPDSIALPQPGERVQVNGTAWRARKRNADLRILCPVDGEVVETGGPGRDWYLKVKPDAVDFAHLLRGCEVRAWLLREMERLELALGTEEMPALADGGAPVEDIASAYPKADWDAVCGQMFLHP